MKQTFLLDTNVFVNAYRHYYHFSFCPAFWKWVMLQNQQRKVYSIDRVLFELSEIEDDLYNWSKSKGIELFEDSNSLKVAEKVNEINDWLIDNEFTEKSINYFYESADIWLIAFAILKEYSVVTHEKVEKTKNKVKIPVVCNAFNVPFVTTFEMLRLEKPKFDLI